MIPARPRPTQPYSRVILSGFEHTPLANTGTEGFPFQSMGNDNFPVPHVAEYCRILKTNNQT